MSTVPPDSESVTPETGEVAGEKIGRRARSRRRWLIEWLVILVVALLVALVVRTYVLQTFFIPSGSMEPTLQVGDRILVDKLSYHLHSVHRGDIVVFRRPPAEDCGGPPVSDLVKRVIGLPGETVAGRNGHVDINGKVLSEPWLPRGVTTSTFGPVTVPKNEYFVMGDNRGDSCDSRTWGPVKQSYIVGRVVMRIWPISRIGFL